ncbi:MAG: hypothetical protein EZS28_031409, partial [Streblomastix strix]
SKYIDPRSEAKVPQILYDFGQQETIDGKLNKGQYEQIINQIIEADPIITIEEADAGIQEYKGKVRQQRHNGGYDPNDLIESNREAQQLVYKLLIPESQQLTYQADADTNQNINDRFNQQSHDVSSKRQPSALDRSIEDIDDKRMELYGGYNRHQINPLFDLNPFESNTDQFTDFASQADSLQQDIGLRDNCGQKPVHPWYGKFPNEPHKQVDYKVTDQGALTAKQRKILLSKEDRLNLDRHKTHKIAANRIISSIKAQEQLKNKIGRKSRKK